MITHLVETSVLTRWSRPPVAEALRPFWDAESIARCTISDLEVGFSASNAHQWDQLQSTLVLLEPIEVTLGVVSRAKMVQRLLAERGLKGGKVPDLIIASAAELAGLTLLHYDRDFELIASVTGQPHAWIVPPGTVD
ncbi:MAG TPA: PIN domain-containing protein [Chloroflexota bacterium]|nr:PIN domain-containing protein [Chloroflexota bacterium]